MKEGSASVMKSILRDTSSTQSIITTESSFSEDSKTPKGKKRIRSVSFSASPPDIVHAPPAATSRTDNSDEQEGRITSPQTPAATTDAMKAYKQFCMLLYRTRKGIDPTVADVLARTLLRALEVRSGGNFVLVSDLTAIEGVPREAVLQFVKSNDAATLIAAALGPAVNPAPASSRAPAAPSSPH